MSGSAETNSENESYTPSVASVQEEPAITPRRHRDNGTFVSTPANEKRQRTIAQDDTVKVVVDTKMYKFGDRLDVSDDASSQPDPRERNKQTSKILMKLVKFLNILTTDGKLAFNRVLAACLRLRNVPKALSDDAATWPPAMHRLKIAEAVIAGIQGHWDAQLSVHLKCALNLSNDKLDRLRAGLGFDCFAGADGKCGKSRKRVPVPWTDHELDLPCIAGSHAANELMLTNAAAAGLAVGGDGSIEIPLRRAIGKRICELTPEDLPLTKTTLRKKPASEAGPEVPAATQRMLVPVDIQLTADGANGDRKKKYVQMCARAMPDPDRQFVFGNTPNSPNNLDLVLLYVGSESYLEWKRQTEECRNQMDHILKNGLVSNFGVDGGEMTKVPIKFSLGADMALHLQEMGVHSYSWCMWCQSNKSDWGVYKKTGGSYACKKFKLWTTEERIHSAHCLADGESSAHCPYCAVEITPEVDRTSREAGATRAVLQCGGQLLGRPPVFTAVANRRKRICFLHILLRIVAIMFKYLIMPSIATERLAKATMEFIEHDLKCYRPKITAATKNINLEVLQVISFRGRDAEAVLASWTDLSTLCMTDDTVPDDGVGGSADGTPTPRAMSISQGEEFREYYAEAARRCPTKEERKARSRRLRSLGTRFTHSWTQAGLSEHITPYIHALVCAIPMQSMDVDLIDHSSQAVEHYHQFLKAIPTNNQLQAGPDEQLVQDVVGEEGQVSRRRNRGTRGCVEQKGVVVAAMMHGGAHKLPPTKATITRESRQRKNGHLDFSQKPDWQSQTNPARIEQLKNKYNLGTVLLTHL